MWHVRPVVSSRDVNKPRVSVVNLVGDVYDEKVPPNGLAHQIGCSEEKHDDIIAMHKSLAVQSLYFYSNEGAALPALARG